MPAANRVTAVDEQTNPDGDYIIEVTCGDGNVIDVAVDLAAAQTLVQVLQKQLVDWAHKSSKNLSLPQLEVNKVDVAHQGIASQLMVTTTQMGVLVLLMSDETLQHARREIDRVQTYRATSPTAH